MKRIQLFELADQPWWPQPMRQALMEYLSYISARHDLYASMLEPLASALRKSDSQRILDLCSGNGGPWPTLLPRLSTMVPLEQVVLSDRFPPPQHPIPAELLGQLSYLSQPVDALQVGKQHHGFRTIWNAFHHFNEQQGVAILHDAVSRGEGIAVFEGVERSPKCILQMALLVPLLMLSDTLQLRPLRITQLIFTYLLPLLPLTTAFDGVVSCLRSYSSDELRSLATRADPQGLYRWECGVDYSHPMTAVTYLIGHPTKSSSM